MAAADIAGTVKGALEHPTTVKQSFEILFSGQKRIRAVWGMCLPGYSL